jgi:hypothetical protein
MKKVLLALASALVLVLVVPLASASAAATKTTISGTVLYNGKGVGNAKVTVVCDFRSKKTKTSTTTGTKGNYSVSFNAKNCPAGSSVTVFAAKGKKGGQNSGAAGTNPINVILAQAVVLPEMGLATSAGAALVGGAGFLAVRRRSLRAQEQEL